MFARADRRHTLLDTQEEAVDHEWQAISEEVHGCLTALMAFVGDMQTGEMHLGLGRAVAKHFPAAGIVTPLRLAHSLAQSSVETLGFTQLVENLNCTAERITKV